MSVILTMFSAPTQIDSPKTQKAYRLSRHAFVHLSRSSASIILNHEYRVILAVNMYCSRTQRDGEKTQRQKRASKTTVDVKHPAFTDRRVPVGRKDVIEEPEPLQSGAKHL